MNQPDKSFFSLAHYTFKEFHYWDSNTQNKLRIDLSPEGLYVKSDRHFLVVLKFEAKDGDDNSAEVICKTRMNGIFKFDDDFTGDIPEYFYANSIAILYPYLRAFISSLTVQANGTKMILPIGNLTALGEVLKDNTDIYETRSELDAI